MENIVTRTHMPDPKIRPVVECILVGFHSAAEVFKELCARRRLRKTSKSPSGEDVEIRTSLSARPREIDTSYTRSVAEYGRRFDIGDTQAHTSLAHILLVLNTGLIDILNKALSKDKTTTRASKQVLLSLTESAAINTLTAFDDLRTRLATQSIPLTAGKAPKNRDEVSRRKAKKKGLTPDQIHQQQHLEAKVLQGGGAWVRAKSGSSVALARPSARVVPHSSPKKRRDRSSAVKLRIAQKAASNIAAESLKGSGQEPLEGLGRNSKSQSQLQLAPIMVNVGCNVQRVPSLLVVPSDYFEKHGVAADAPPPRPPKIPLHERPNPAMRVRPSSGATFRTVSTKIGEIPEHKLFEPSGLSESKAQLPLPYIIPPMLTAEPPKKRHRFRFWKRRDPWQDIAAY